MNWATINLNELLAQIWPWLERACQEEGNPLRTPVFGSANEHEISVRTVVLRQVQPANRELVCQSDYRSRKCWEIRKNPQVRWLFYHPDEHIQIRAGGPAVVHQLDAVARVTLSQTPNGIVERVQQWPGVTRCVATPTGVEFAAQNVAPMLPKLMTLCAEHGVECTNIELEQPSLERVFLSLTGHALRD